MKKNYFKIILLSITIIFVLTGCVKETDVEHLSKWSFQYNEYTNDYSLFFAFSDSNKKQIAADANIDIRIVNKADEVLYKKTLTISKDNFDYFTNESNDENYLANIKIPKDQIKKGKSPEGTVFFKVYNEGYFEFDECNYPILFNLPTENFSIKSEPLPKEISIKGYDGSTQSKLLIENMTVDVNDTISPVVTITISGKKTYANSSPYAGMDNFEYQLCDSDGYVVENGSVYLNGLNSADQFKDSSINFYDLVPGEEYIIKFINTKW